jgi:hypothetical protein
MNFFRRKDTVTQPGEPEGASRPSEPFMAERVEASPSEAPGPGECDVPRAEADRGSGIEGEKTCDPLPSETLPGHAPPTGEKDSLEFPGEASPRQADAVVSDQTPTRNPFEERLASLRQRLQEGPRPIPDASIQLGSESEATPEQEFAAPTTEPAFSAPSPEVAFSGPAAVPMPETIADIQNQAPSGVEQGTPPPVSALDGTREIAADAEKDILLPPIVSNPMVGVPGRRAGRVKTRLLGFERSATSSNDPIGSAAKAATSGQFPVGWIVVVKGPGRGASFCLYNGLSQIGRGSDQTVCLDFGDTSISRENHAVVAYDSEQRKHFLGHGGKANIVRLNDMPVLSTEELSHGDQIRIGETTLRFVALCGDGFDWSMTATDDDFDAALI